MVIDEDDNALEVGPDDNVISSDGSSCIQEENKKVQNFPFNVVHKLTHRSSMLGNEFIHGEVEPDFVERECIAENALQQLGHDMHGTALWFDQSKNEVDNKEGVVQNL